eukprot:scaffold1900_cov123-Cylindrotheca_fusiformis.AAC.23
MDPLGQRICRVADDKELLFSVPIFERRLPNIGFRDTCMFAPGALSVWRPSILDSGPASLFATKRLFFTLRQVLRKSRFSVPLSRLQVRNQGTEL